MKKTVYLLLFFITNAVYGQTPKLTFGIAAGPGVVNLYGNDILRHNHKPTIGFAGGAFCSYQLHKDLFIGANFMFERKGSFTSMAATDLIGNQLGNAKTYSRLNYLTIPVFLRKTFGNKVKFMLNAGAFSGYLLKFTVTSEGSIGIKRKGDYTSNLKRIDIGVIVGAGFELPVTDKLSFSLEVRENLGLFNTSALPVLNDGAIKTTAFNLICCMSKKIGT